MATIFYQLENRWFHMELIYVACRAYGMLQFCSEPEFGPGYSDSFFYRALVNKFDWS